MRYLEHALVTPDNNAVENAIRPFVLGKKNWLFSNTSAGAHTGAGLYSLIETAKANGHEPYKYLCYLFDMLSKAKTLEEKLSLKFYIKQLSFSCQNNKYSMESSKCFEHSSKAIYSCSPGSPSCCLLRNKIVSHTAEVIAWRN